MISIYCKKCGNVIDKLWLEKHQKLCSLCYNDYMRKWNRTEVGLRNHRIQSRKFNKTPNKKIISKRWKDKNKEKLIAENKFLYAVRHKYILIEPCQICGKKAHGHHSDYSKPYDVNWLCPLHHKAMHLGEISDLKIYHYDVNYTIIQKTLFHD